MALLHFISEDRAGPQGQEPAIVDGQEPAIVQGQEPAIVQGQEPAIVENNNVRPEVQTPDPEPAQHAPGPAAAPKINSDEGQVGQHPRKKTSSQETKTTRSDRRIPQSLNLR